MPTIRLTRATVAGARFFVSPHSQIRITDQPAFRSSRFTFRSRFWFRVIFASQNSAFCFGRVPCRGQPCQKHPSTNTATRAARNTKSGLTFSPAARTEIVQCRRHPRIPASFISSISLTSVARFPNDRTSAITSLRFAGVKTSDIVAVYTFNAREQPADSPPSSKNLRRLHPSPLSASSAPLPLCGKKTEQPPSTPTHPFIHSSTHPSIPPSAPPLKRAFASPPPRLYHSRASPTPAMRYHLHEHPAFPGLLTKEDLFLLVERGSLARGDLCTDTRTGRDHTVGDVISGMRPPGGPRQARISRPAYQEIRADSPLTDDPHPDTDPETEDEDENENENENENEDEIEDPDAEAPQTGPEDADEAPLDAGAYTAAGELILHRSHPAWLSYGKALFLVLLLAITTAMLMRIEPGYAPLSGGLALSLLLAVIVGRFSRDYCVTEERVEVVWGILGRSSKEVRICDIRSIDVYETGLKGFLGLGTVDFSSAANAGIEVAFRDIRGAHEVKELVRQLQRSSR